MTRDKHASPDTQEIQKDKLYEADGMISKWDTKTTNTMLFQSNPLEATQYLTAVQNLQQLMENLSVADSNSAEMIRAENLMQMSMARLQNEFHNILLSNSDPVDRSGRFSANSSTEGSGRRSSGFSANSSTEGRGRRSSGFSANSSTEGSGRRSSGFSANSSTEGRGRRSRGFSANSSTEGSGRRSSGFSANSSKEGSGRRSSGFSSDEDDGTPVSACPSIDRNCDLDTFPFGAVADLRKIAESMASAGYGRDCVRVFAVTRKSVVEESLYNLGVEKLTLHDVQKMEWAALEDKIRKWIYAAKISMRLLFAREKRLCDQVFEGYTQLRDSVFTEVAKEPAGRVLGFAEAMAAGKPSAEKMFKVLDMYETLTEIIPDISEIFCEKPCQDLQTQAANCAALLGEAAWGILTEFESSLEKESSKATILGGAVHPVTRYVVNYVAYLYDYKDTFANLTPADLPQKLLQNFAPELDDDVDFESAPLSIHVGWIAVLLQCKLDAKATLYKDPALSYLFLMNNLHYVVEKVKRSEVKSVLGDKWLRKQSNMVRQYAANYERAAWSKVLSFLTEEGSCRASQQVLKERVKAVNVAIEGVIKRHEGWVVPDLRLREELAISISQRVMPAYRSFLGRFERRLESGRHSHVQVKYTADDLENFVLDLFNGGASSMSSKRRQR